MGALTDFVRKKAWFGASKKAKALAGEIEAVQVAGRASSSSPVYKAAKKISRAHFASLVQRNSAEQVRMLKRAVASERMDQVMHAIGKGVLKAYGLGWLVPIAVAGKQIADKIVDKNAPTSDKERIAAYKASIDRFGAGLYVKEMMLNHDILFGRVSGAGLLQAKELSQLETPVRPPLPRNKGKREKVLAEYAQDKKRVEGLRLAARRYAKVASNLQNSKDRAKLREGGSLPFWTNKPVEKTAEMIIPPSLERAAASEQSAKLLPLYLGGAAVVLAVWAARR